MLRNGLFLLLGIVACAAQCVQHGQGTSFTIQILSRLATQQPAAVVPISLPNLLELDESPFGPEEKADVQRRVLRMFYHAYDSYILYAFPHDELKPLSKTYTDSLGELGNINMEHLSRTYKGVAMTLIDSLSTLAVIGNRTEFAKNVNWLTDNMSFDVDVRVNVFEANIRLLGGLLSAHLLALDPDLGMVQGYNGGLLDLAYDLGLRLLPAFLESPTGLPFAWVNLRHGVEDASREVTETNTAACGSLTLEMTVLSRLTGSPVFEEAARRSLRKLWSMRSPLGLLGTSLDMLTGQWLHPTSGTIGASSDSFYEYLLKAFILFGDEEYWDMFQEAYSSAVLHYKQDGWYHDSDIFSGQPTHMQFTSLQGFWPGMQVLVGDVAASRKTFARFFSVVQHFKLPPERYLFNTGQIHPTERYYPLRPELIESAYYLYQATGDPYLQRVGRFMVDSLYKYAWAEGGLASIRSVATMEQEDYMPSFFLAETCKYLYLLYNDTLSAGSYVLTTEGHPFSISALRYPAARPAFPRRRSATTLATHPYYGAANLRRAMAIATGGDPFLPASEGASTDDVAPDADVASTAGGVSVADVASVADVNPLRPSIPPGGSYSRRSRLKPAQSPAPSTRQTRSAPAARAVQWWYPDWGLLSSNVSALAARVCPLPPGVGGRGMAGQRVVMSLCHILDRWPDHTCRGDIDCGVDGDTCRSRRCTAFNFCDVM